MQRNGNGCPHPFRRNNLFFEPFAVMPTRIIVNPYRAVRYDRVPGVGGRFYPCDLVAKCIDDLFDHGFLSNEQHHASMGALTRHMYDGELPGDTLFYTPYSGECVYFLEFCDDLMNMLEMAIHFRDDMPLDDPLGEVDWERSALGDFPVNIGAFRLNPNWDFLVDGLQNVTFETEELSSDSDSDFGDWEMNG